MEKSKICKTEPLITKPNKEIAIREKKIEIKTL